ncbi:hypothetical protein [Pelagibius sp. Alg239-R121]|uniref:hypothetical protein n=1 Tax=Pelagibius sp. Alg239-R121 TaxID=2993448 RepID=UPI0024A7544B|nr:hypothetical protein [Pelagibius sp. Alg239-R121]
MIRVRHIFIALLAGALAACGPLPRPFQHEAGENNALLTLKDGTGIVVLQPESELVPDPSAWAEAMAEALRARDVPASTNHANAGSRYLLSHVTEVSDGSRAKSISVLWDLYAPDGKLAGTYAQEMRLSREAFQQSSVADTQRVIEQAADKLAALAGTRPRATRSIPGFPDAKIHVAPFGDVPGDAAISLRNAIVAELTDSRLPLAGKASADDLLLLCDISLGPIQEGRQKATISWTLRAVRDSEELGVVDQSNFVPAGSLDGVWGPTARDIARGAREGLLDLIGQLQSGRQAQKLP